MRRLLVALAALILAAASPAAAQQGNGAVQPFPSHPLQFVVPFPPGGATDVIARLIAGPLGEALGQPVVVENRPGAGGTVGSAQVARAVPDGHTLLMGTIATHGIGPSLYPQIPYDAMRDFAPVTQAASQVYAVLVHPSVPARTIGELIALAKAHPGTLTYASAGSGTAAHLFAELFKEMAGVDIMHVPYRGAGPAMVALLGGQVSMTFDVVLTTLEHIRAGRLRALAVTGARRSSVLPEVPTLQEAGLAGYEAVGWNGVFLPAGTPPAIRQRLAEEIRRALHRPEVRERIEQQGAEVVASSPEAFAAFVRAEIARWREVVARTGARPE